MDKGTLSHTYGDSHKPIPRTVPNLYLGDSAGALEAASLERAESMDQELRTGELASGYKSSNLECLRQRQGPRPVRTHQHIV